jgi:hypothetical protein
LIKDYESILTVLKGSFTPVNDPFLCAIDSDHVMHQHMVIGRSEGGYESKYQKSCFAGFIPANPCSGRIYISSIAT